MTLLNTTPPTAPRAMTELKAVGLVNLDEDVVPEDETEENRHGRPGLQMTLKEEYKWFLNSDTILKLLQYCNCLLQFSFQGDCAIAAK